MKNNRLALLIPIHEESRIINNVITEIQREIASLLEFNSIVYIINNGSSDDTLKKLILLLEFTKLCRKIFWQVFKK